MSKDASFGPKDPGEAYLFARATLELDFQRLLHVYLRDQGLTRRDLAERLGVDVAYVDKLFTDGVVITLDDVSDVFQALGLKCSLTVEKHHA